MNTTQEVEKRVTLATLKKFIRDNKDNLYALCKSNFDGMTDCVQQVKTTPKKVNPAVIDLENKHTLGIGQIWLVGSSRDWFKAFEDDVFQGINGSNSCGSWTLARIK